MKVTQSEVEYKKFTNQNGPTYTISIKDLQCINYENGTKDTFVSSNNNPNTTTNEASTQSFNDRQLLSLYNDVSTPLKIKKAKNLKRIGWFLGGAITAVGIGLCVYALADPDYYSGYGYYDDNDTELLAGSILAGAGVATWAGFYYAGKHIEKKYANSVQASTIYQQEIKVGKNDRLMVGIDMLKDKTRKNQTLGFGVTYNF